MNLTISEDEKKNLLFCIRLGIKSADDTLSAAEALMPLARKISLLKDEVADTTKEI